MNLIERVRRGRWELEQYQNGLAAATLEADRLEALLQSQELAQALLQKVAKDTQEQLKFHLESLVQSALDSVFPGVYTFQLEFKLARGKTEAEIYLDKDGERINPMDSSGGGVVDVVAFALRVATWAIGRTDNVLILDEPFKWLSVGLRPLAGDILKGLSKRLGLQVIMVTHDEEMIGIADRIFSVDQRRRRSIVKATEGEVYA